MHEKISLVRCKFHISNEKDEEEDNHIQWGKQYFAKELINITTTITPLDHESLVVSVSKINPRYYVYVPTNFSTINQI
jgi:hypothetical protein